MTVEEAMKTRRSVRRFRIDHPGRERIESLIELAVTAPSASNKQPWRFFATDNRQTIERMAEAVQEAVDRIVQHIDSSYMDAFRAYGDYFVRFKTAPVVIVVAYREIVVLSNLVDSDLEKEDLEQIRMMEFNSGLTSTSLAIENLLLSAHSSGLGASCMTGPLVAANTIKSILAIPDSWNIAAVIAVGYPDEEPQPTGRKSAEVVLRWANS